MVEDILQKLKEITTSTTRIVKWSSSDRKKMKPDGQKAKLM